MRRRMANFVDGGLITIVVFLAVFAYLSGVLICTLWDLGDQYLHHVGIGDEKKW